MTTTDQPRAAGLKQRPGDQPLPTRNDRPDVQSMVMADITARREVGISRYGTALQPFNGRDALRDLYEELLDACMYIRQAIEERDTQPPDTAPATLPDGVEVVTATVLTGDGWYVQEHIKHLLGNEGYDADVVLTGSEATPR